MKHKTKVLSNKCNVHFTFLFDREKVRDAKKFFILFANLHNILIQQRRSI